MNLAQKIKLLRSQRDWTQEDLAKISGISLQSIKLYETNKHNGITTTNLKKLSKAFDIDLDFFLNESSPITDKKFANSSPIVRQSQNLSSSQNNLSSSAVNMSSISQNQSNTTDLTISQKEQLQDEQIYITSLTSAVGAGESVDIDGIEVFDSDILIPFSKILFKTPPNYAKLRCMRVDGYSMMPMLYPDSWVIAEISSEFQGDGLYIINFSGNFMVKMVQKSPSGALDIISINKDYKSYTIGEDDDTEIRIIGKVLRCVI
ncbi:MAG: LexA family transcriptional regulator [Campylobacter sputorum]|uniref:XRE family transcriptional regulator n=1 Tax=Campylobacter sputorum TaxID=206 RepID=UPI002A91C56D|nr:LexA family transcriptional regulator [Campylobacter sputorum]MDY6120034.1 LexA family transcriptional regulator [Campylobacter sputorum]